MALTSNACTFYVDEVFWWWFSYLQSRMMTRKIARNKRTLNKTLLFSGNFFRLGAFFNPLSAISNLFVNPFIRRIILGFMPYKKAFCWKICQVPGLSSKPNDVYFSSIFYVYYCEHLKAIKQEQTIMFSPFSKAFLDAKN